MIARRTWTRAWRVLLALGVAWAVAQGASRAGEGSRRERHAAAADLFTNGVLRELKLEIPAEGMRSLRQNPRRYVPATLREGQQAYAGVQVRLKGGAGSFRWLDDKPGLTVKLADSSPTFHGLDKFHLNNSEQDGTYLSEWICGEMFRQAGVPAARATLTTVELNGRRLGLYVLVESIDRDFLREYFANVDGNVYGQSPNADIDSPLEVMGGREPTRHKDLRRLAIAASERDPALLGERLAAVLDVERFLSFMALEAMLHHWDGYTYNVKNYQVFHDLDRDKLVFIPHDLDQVLRSPQESIMSGGHGMVSRAILRCPETRLRYRERVSELYTNVFVAPALSRRIDERVAQFAPGLRAYDAGLARSFADGAKELKNRIASRSRGLAAQLRLPDPGALKFVNNVAQVKGWRVPRAQASASQAEVPEPAGKTSLWIAALAPTTASWRAVVPLVPGRYAFEGMARCVGVVPSPNDPKGSGAGLRASGYSRPQTAQLTGNSDWRKLTYEFTVTDQAAEVDLICELRAGEGEVWFDRDSLRLVRRP